MTERYPELRKFLDKNRDKIDRRVTEIQNGSPRRFDWYGKQPTKAREAMRDGPMTFKEDRIGRRLWFALDVIAAAGLVACAAALFWFLK